MPFLSLELLSLTCQTPKKRVIDTVKLYLAVGTGAGDVDKFESNTGPTQQDINRGPYDFHAGKTLNFSDSPPLGRSTWRSRNVNLSENSEVAFVLAGIGQHKAELGGGGAQAGELGFELGKKTITAFLSLVPKVGSILAELAAFGLDIAGQPDPDNECNGPLFSFNKTYSGADLIFNLVKNKSQSVQLQPHESAPVGLHSNCRQPAYSASLVLRNGTVIRVDRSEVRTEKGRSNPIALTDHLPACKPDRIAQFWIISSEIVLTFRPSVPFTTLGYAWRLDGVGDSSIALSDGAGQYTVRSHASHYNQQTGISRTETVDAKLHCNVRADGVLEIRIPATEGNFRFQVSCYLRHGDQTARIDGQSYDVVTETVDGNAEYQEYIACRRAWWARQRDILHEFSEHLKKIPLEVPHFDPVDVWKPFDKFTKSATRVIEEVKKAMPKKPVR